MMELDWSTFIPNLLATFVGVLLSFILTFGAYRLVDCIRIGQRRNTTKRLLIYEIAGILVKLRSCRELAHKVLEGGSYIQILYDPAHSIYTPAYNTAYQRGDIYRLGDDALERDLFKYAAKCEVYNARLHHSRELIVGKFGLHGTVRKNFVEMHVNNILPEIEDLIEKSNDLLQKMGLDVSKINTDSPLNCN